MGADAEAPHLGVAQGQAGVQLLEFAGLEGLSAEAVETQPGRGAERKKGMEIAAVAPSVRAECGEACIPGGFGVRVLIDRELELSEVAGAVGRVAGLEFLVETDAEGVERGEAVDVPPVGETERAEVGVEGIVVDGGDGALADVGRGAEAIGEFRGHQVPQAVDVPALVPIVPGAAEAEELGVEARLGQHAGVVAAGRACRSAFVVGDAGADGRGDGQPFARGEGAHGAVVQVGPIAADAAGGGERIILPQGGHGGV